MQRPTHILIILLSMAFLSACNRPVEHVHAHSGEPNLREFQVIDSFGYTESPGYAPILDPNVSDGLFDIYWRADSFYDYWVTVGINDRPSMANSIILSEELCGYDLACDYDGSQVCAYDAEFFMGCGADLYELERNMVDIFPLIFDLPEHLYLNIELCDETGRFCEVSSRPVTLY